MKTGGEDYCQYHPLTAAGWRCRNCGQDYCDQCITKGAHTSFKANCQLCDMEVTSLGGAGGAEPFWRRIEASFRYPLTPDAGGLIILGALIETFALFLALPFAILFSLIVTGIVTRYSFNCLKATAEGKFIAPKVLESYQQGGILLLLKLFLMIILLSLLGGLAIAFSGQAFGSLVSFVILLLLPAMIMLFAMKDSLLSGLNLIAAWRLVSAIGMPYGLLLGIIIIMMTSMAVVGELLSGTRFFVQVLQFAASNYYLIVMFHIMGYVLFQYQQELGYVAERDDDSKQLIRTEREETDARLNVLVKAGRYEDLLKEFASATKHFPGDHTLAQRYLTFLLATQQKKPLNDYASTYFSGALKRNQAEPLAQQFHAVRRILPDYLPNQPEVRLALARQLYGRNELKGAIELLNGLHTKFPKFSGLSEAYNLMADLLETLPNMATQAQKCRTFATQLARQRP